LAGVTNSLRRRSPDIDPSLIVPLPIRLIQFQFESGSRYTESLLDQKKDSRPVMLLMI